MANLQTVLSVLVTKGGGKLSERFIKFALFSALQALVVMHGHNVVHRDIKSDIFFLHPNGQIKIYVSEDADFLSQE